jgi:hypothetical protein
MNYNMGCAFANAIVILAEGTGMLRLGAIANGGGTIPLCNLSFTNTISLDACLEVEHRRVESLWLKASATWRGSLWLKASMIGVGGPSPFEFFPDIFLTTEEKCYIQNVFRGSLYWPAAHQSSRVERGWIHTALGRHKWLPSSRTNGFPASANFESKLLVNAPMWSAKNGIPKSSWICLLLTYQGALVAMRRHLDCNTCIFRTASNGHPDRPCIVHDRTDELLVKQPTDHSFTPLRTRLSWMFSNSLPTVSSRLNRSVRRQRINLSSVSIDTTRASFHAGGRCRNTVRVRSLPNHVSPDSL